MKVMVIVKASEQSEAGKLPSSELLAKMGAYNQQLVSAGVIQAGEGLKSSANGVRVKFDGDRRTVSKGPFANMSELISGYWIWNVKSLDDAIEWLKRAPFDGGAELEIRPVFSAEDFAPKMTPEIKAQAESLRQQLAATKQAS